MTTNLKMRILSNTIILLLLILPVIELPLYLINLRITGVVTHFIFTLGPSTLGMGKVTSDDWNSTNLRYNKKEYLSHHILYDKTQWFFLWLIDWRTGRCWTSFKIQVISPLISEKGNNMLSRISKIRDPKSDLLAMGPAHVVSGTNSCDCGRSWRPRGTVFRKRTRCACPLRASKGPRGQPCSRGPPLEFDEIIQYFSVQKLGNLQNKIGSL